MSQEPFRGNPSACPTCGRGNDAASQLPAGAEPPQAGDWSLCWGCGAVAVFTGEGVNVRPCTDEELVESTKDKELARLRREMRAFQARWRP